MTKIKFQYSVTMPAMHNLSHFTEGQTKAGSVRLCDLIKEIREEKIWRSLKN